MIKIMLKSYFEILYRMMDLYNIYKYIFISHSLSVLPPSFLNFYKMIKIRLNNYFEIFYRMMDLYNIYIYNFIYIYIFI